MSLEGDCYKASQLCLCVRKEGILPMLRPQYTEEHQGGHVLEMVLNSQEHLILLLQDLEKKKKRKIVNIFLT